MFPAAGVRYDIEKAEDSAANRSLTREAVH